MDIPSIISYVLLGAFALFALLSALIGLGRGLKKSVASTVVIVVSALIAFLVTILAFRPSPSHPGLVVGKIMELIPQQEGATAGVFEMESIQNALFSIIYMITAPFIFVLLFVAIRFILGIVMRIVLRFIPWMNKIPKVAKRLGGLGVGLVNGVLLFLILFMPLIGTVDVVSSAVHQLQEIQEAQEEEEEIKADNVSKMEQLDAGEDYDEDDIYDDHEDEDEEERDEFVDEESLEVIEAISDKGIGKFILSCGGRLMYNSLASTKYYGQKVYLKNEVAVIIEMVPALEGMSEGGEKTMQAIDVFVESIDKSPIIADCSADLLSQMGKAWLKGEAFLGVERISMGSEWMDPMLDEVINILATEDRDHVYADLKSIAGFMHAVDDIGLLNVEDMDSKELDILGKKGTLTHLLEPIEGNNRMLPIIDQLNVSCIKVFSDDLGFFETRDDIYEDLIASLAEVASKYNFGIISKTQAVEKISFEIQDHGIELTEAEAGNVANALLADCSGLYQDAEQRVKEFFILYNAALTSKVVVDSDSSVNANGVKLSTYYSYNYQNSAAYMLASQGVSIGNAASITSGENIKTVLVTTKEIVDSVVKYADIKDKHKETESIDEVMVSMIEAFNELGDDSLHASYVMEQMGHVLDKMHQTTVFGNTTDTFLMAIMQSHKVAGSIGLNVIEMTDFANKIHEGVNNGTGYEQISVTVSQSFDVLENINDGQLKKDKIQDLMKDLTPETAQVMQNIATPSLMQNYGVKKESAEKSSNAVSSLFGNMANYTNQHPQGDMSDEEYKASIAKEAEAVDKIITLAIKANEEIDQKEPLFDKAGNSGALDMSAYDVIDLFASSTVAEDTVNELVVGNDNTDGKFDPLGAGNGFLESDKAEMIDALNQYGEDNKDVEGIDEKLTNIGAFFGIVYGG